jgi:NAD(P)-dependent dehydrogenase (short-subunit alcohol dehydrogenase family)
VVAGDLQAPQIDDVLGVEVDVAEEEAVDRAFGRIEAELATVDLLVLNAGIFVIEPFEETTLASWQRTLDVNLTGAFLCARRALPGMRERGFGRLVAIGSSAGKTGGAKSIAAYGASKAGIMAMAKSIASEYAGTGVTANALAPALIDTDMVAAMPDMRERVPLGRFGTTQEVADVVAFLCSDHSSFITGEVVDVNGGFLID